MTYSVETRDLWRIYQTGTGQEVVGLGGVSVQLEQGRFIAMKGRSGSGKTTFLNCIGGLDQPTRGEVLVLGESVKNFDTREISAWRRENIGFVFQSFGLMPTLSAFENVELIPRMLNLPQKERKSRSLEILELVGLKKWVHHRPFEMSGGQQQRVAIARALVNYPKLLIADEPTGELDSDTAREILGLFRNISADQQLTILIATHDNLVDEYADSVIALADGRVESHQILKT